MVIVRVIKLLLLVGWDFFALIFQLGLILDLGGGLRHKNEFLWVTTTGDPSESTLGACWLSSIALEGAISKSICSLA